MHVEYHEWNSVRLNAKSQMKVYGYWGIPVLVFPCAGGSFYEFEDFKMNDAISDLINSGKVKIFTVGSHDSKSWLNSSISISERAQAHEVYVDYLVSEVVPFIYSHMKSCMGITLFGCSLGAMHAVSLALRFPEIFTSAIGLSGIFRITRLTGGYIDEILMRSSPIDYVRSLEPSDLLRKVRELNIAICCGQGAWEHECLEDTIALREAFEQKAVPAWVDIWGRDVSHDWPWWRKQMPYFLSALIEKQERFKRTH
ncbi:MAG: esterase family protein [Candidatus Riflebacteria bacterium]|nr:esterase family protein [Candidatus Riflebacteria bacterium]